MGLFKRRQDNFTLIADNVIAFYMILKDNYGEAYKNEQLLFASGLMDVFSYLQEGSITPNEVAKAVVHAKKGDISIKGRKITHARKSEDDDMSGYDPDENELLLNFVMQLECVIMNSRRSNPTAVIQLVNSRKGKIKECIDKGLAEGKNHKFYEPLEEQAKEWFMGRTMNKMILSFKI